MKTDLDRCLEELLNAPAFAARFERAGEIWDAALQIEALNRNVPTGRNRHEHNNDSKDQAQEK